MRGEPARFAPVERGFPQVAAVTEDNFVPPDVGVTEKFRRAGGEGELHRGFDRGGLGERKLFGVNRRKREGRNEKRGGGQEE